MHAGCLPARIFKHLHLGNSLTSLVPAQSLANQLTLQSLLSRDTMARVPEADMNIVKIDEQLAAEMEVRAVHRLKEDWGAQLQACCDHFDDYIAEARQTIQNHIRGFNRQKAIFFATLRKVEGEERASRVIESGLDTITPQEFAKIARLLEGEKATSPAAATPYSSPPQSPLRPNTLSIEPREGAPSPQHSNAAITGAALPPKSSAKGKGVAVSQLSTPPHLTPKTGTWSKSTPMKRSPDQAEASNPPAKKPKLSSAPKQTTRNRNLDSWEVEGTDYIFAYPPFGSGWFVLRCNHGLATKPLLFPFTSDPFKKERLAWEHFNGSKALKCHETSKKYTDDEIMMNFAHRGKCSRDHCKETLTYESP